MIGVHIECDECGHWLAYSNTNMTDGKARARRAGWMFGKHPISGTLILCPKCRAAKVKKPTRR